MTVSTETTKSATVVGNGVTTAFPFAFKIFQTSDVSVVLAVAATGVETVLTEGVDYSVSMNVDQEGDPGGEVTYPLSGSPMASTHSLTLVRDVPATQGLDLTLGGSFNPDNIEKALDRVTTLVQQLKEAVDRAIKVSISSGLTPDEFFLDNITNAEANANAAAVSAAAALVSEIAAVAAAEDFLSKYIGASATDPTVDGNGDALTEGDLYWNTAVPEFRVYSSGSWIAFLDPGLLTVTPFAETLLDDSDVATARGTLGLGTAATANIGTSGATVPLLDTAIQAFSGEVIFTNRIRAESGSNVFLHQTPTNADFDMLEAYDSTSNLVGSLRVYDMDGAGGGGLAINTFDAFVINPPLICTSGGTVVGSFFVQNSPVATYTTYTGSTQATLPLGSIVLCYDSGAVGYARHSVVPVKYASANTFFFTTGTGVPLTGTWRSRGYLYTDSPTNTENYVLCQRVA